MDFAIAAADEIKHGGAVDGPASEEIEISIHRGPIRRVRVVWNRAERLGQISGVDPIAVAEICALGCLSEVALDRPVRREIEACSKRYAEAFGLRMAACGTDVADEGIGDLMGRGAHR